MTFKLACGDVMPGCTARFENTDRGQLMGQVAAHAASAHGITDITPTIRQAVESQIVSIAS
jgi:predicted small metal-binding protein